MLNPSYWYIHGRPYDLSTWLADHPGGPEIINACRGTDCTVLYETYHAASLRPEWIASLQARYAVHDAPHIPQDPSWAKTPFYDDLKHVVQRYRMEHGVKATTNAVAWYAAMGVVHYSFFFKWITGAGEWWVPIVFGLTLWFWAGDMMHTGTHYALCKSASLSRTLGMFGGWMFCLPHTWFRQHVTGHHVHTNESGKDPDLYHWQKIFNVCPGLVYGTDKLASLWYVSPVFTQFIVPALCTLEILTQHHWVGVDDIIPFYAGERTMMWCVWALYMAMLVGVVAVHGVVWALAPSAVGGCVFYAFSQVSHLNAASFDTPMTEEWAVGEMTTSQGDYSPDSLVWNKLSVGLNNQTIHHLFPSIHPCHYPELSRRCRKVFKKHGLPQAPWSQTYWDALRQHCRWLRYLNQ